MRAVVVGDVLLDRDIEGDSTRVSPDSGAPVVDIRERTRRAGGAGLVARMLAQDGHETTLVTALGDDEAGWHLRDELRGIDLVAGASLAPTPVKTRVRSNGRAFARIDEECGAPPPPRIDRRMLAAIADADVIIAADYGRGLLADPRVRGELEQHGQRVPLVWDPHPRGTTPVRATSLATPNRAEAAALADVADEEDAVLVGRLLLATWRCGAVAVTLGDEGAMLLRSDRSESRIPARAVPDADPCGAGDRFAAAAAVALAESGDPEAAVRAAVSEAAGFLAAGGVSSMPTLAAPPVPGDGVEALIARVRGRGGTIVAAGGCFDLLHAGHVRTLQTARTLGDCLVVCINSDDSVRRLKGASRPIIGERDRAEMLEALGCVDGVLVFDEDTPEQLLAALRPDIWVKGGDYSPDALPERRLLEQWGGRAVTLPYHLGRSTTALAGALAAVV